MKPIDRRKLLDWLKDRQNHRNLLLAAVYGELITRIAAGQFDSEKERRG